MDTTLIVETALGIVAINPATDAALRITDKVRAVRAARTARCASGRVPDPAPIQSPAGTAEPAPVPAVTTTAETISYPVRRDPVTRQFVRRDGSNRLLDANGAAAR